DAGAGDQREGAPAPIVKSPTRTAPSFDDTELLQERYLLRLGAMRQRGAHESAEDRMTIERTRLELGVELTRQEPRMVGELDHFDQAAVGRDAGQDQAFLLDT